VTIREGPPRTTDRPTPDAGTPATRSEKALGVLLSALSGTAFAAQSRINGELGVRLGDGVLAALISFGTGLALLLLVIPLVPAARDGVARLTGALRHGRLRFWQCLGGFAGAFLVATQSLTVGVIGVAVFSVALVAGQTGSSLLVDRAGVGPAGHQPLTWPRVVGAALTLVAVVGAMSHRVQGGVALWLVVLPLLAGFGIAVQQAVNGQVRAAARSALTATLVNFVAGTALLTVAWLVVGAVRWAPSSLPTEPWLYLGGLLGVLFIAVATVVVRWIGVLLLGLSAIAGQLVGAVVLDLVVPAPDARLHPTTVAGAALTLVAVGIAALPGGRLGRPAPRPTAER
jgi:transporter family-2 protein